MITEIWIERAEWWMKKISSPMQTSERMIAPEVGGCQERHEGAADVLLAADGAEDEHRVGKGADEDGEDDLVGTVAGELAQHAGCELAGGELHGDDGDREDGAGNGDDGGSDGGEDAARAFGASAEDPGEPLDIPGAHQPVIQPDEEEGERTAEHGADGGEQPEAVLHVLPPGSQPRRMRHVVLLRKLLPLIPTPKAGSGGASLRPKSSCQL
jgi:hypothetical protein